MKIITTILILIIAVQAFAQFEVFPIYRLVNVDSLSSIGDNQFVKSIEVNTDTILIDIGAKTYAFVSSSQNKGSKFSVPVFTASFDPKYNIEISSWQLIRIETEYVTFKITYTRRHIKQGGQKGKHYIIDNYKISKDEIVGIYVGEVDKKQRAKTNLINAGLAIAVIGAVIIGTQ